MRCCRDGSGVRIGIGVGRREGIHHPGQPAIVADHDVGIRIEGEKRRELGTRSRTLRRISSRLSELTSSLNGSLAKIAAVERDQ